MGRTTTTGRPARAAKAKTASKTKTTDRADSDVELVTAETIEADIIRIIKDYAKENFGNGTKLNFLYDELIAEGHKLTIGMFQDVLRAAHKAGRLTLRGWGQPLDLLPPGEHAFFIATTVMFFVYPR